MSWMLLLSELSLRGVFENTPKITHLHLELRADHVIVRDGLKKGKWTVAYEAEGFKRGVF